jgi:hypothetical protein
LPGIGAASLAQRDSLLLCDDVRPRLTDAHDGIVQLGQPIAEIMHGCAFLHFGWEHNGSLSDRRPAGRSR